MVTVEVAKLAAVFLIIIVILWIKRPLYQAVLAGIAASIILFGISAFQSVRLFVDVVTSWKSMSILFVFYFITFLQRILEKRSQIKLAQKDLNRIFNNRRINASIAPFFIGLLPSAAAMILCGDIVKESSEGYLDAKEQAFVANWYRHIPESTLPTYPGVILMSTLAGVALSEFIVGMIIPVITLAVLGYVAYLRKLPKDTGNEEESTNKLKDFCMLFVHLWSLLTIIFLIIAFKLSTLLSVFIVIIASILIYKIKWTELRPMFKGAIEPKMLGNMFLVLVLKEFVTYTGTIYMLPDFFSMFPIPMYMIFALLFFFGCLITGSSGIIALGTTLAFTAIPEGGMPLMVLLMCICHGASLLSPTHVCLVIISDYFNITLGELIRKTLPVVLTFCILMIGYYNILLLLS